MKIIDLAPEHEKPFYCCLEEWSDDMKEAGNHKACWYNNMKDKGLRVKLALNDEGKICGMIQYLPSEFSCTDGKNLFFVLCIWVHGHKQGVGNNQKKGVGKALLKAAEDDVKSVGAKGLITWGIVLPFFMRASWFKKQGHKVVDKYGMLRLLWKPFTEDAIPPKFIKRVKKPSLVPGKVNVSIFNNGWCTVQNIAYERTLRAIEDLKDKIVLNVYRTAEREIFTEWGIFDGIYVDDKEIATGPPLSYKKIRRVIEKRVNRIK
jgi:hypothetical protein